MRPCFLLPLEGDIRYCILRRFVAPCVCFGSSGLESGLTYCLRGNRSTFALLAALLYTLRCAPSSVYQLPTQHASLFLTVHVSEPWRWPVIIFSPVSICVASTCASVRIGGRAWSSDNLGLWIRTAVLSSREGWCALFPDTEEGAGQRRLLFFFISSLFLHNVQHFW